MPSAENYLLKAHIEKLPAYLSLMRADKPIGSLLLLWPTLWALWLASNGEPAGIHVWVFVLGVFVMRSAGCVINDYADRDIDGKVERTQSRPLATGALSSSNALVLFVVLLLCALVLLLQLPSNVWPWSLPAVVLTIIYPFMKRFIEAPQLVLGLAFSFGIPMAFASYQHPFDSAFYLLFSINFLWVLIYDTVYAMSDREDDLKIGVKSTAIYFGEKDRLIVAVLQVVVVILCLCIMWLLHLDLSFLFAICLVSIMFGYQQWLIKDRQREACFGAFLNNAWVGAVLWLGLLSAY